MIRLIGKEIDTEYACNMGGPGSDAGIRFKSFDGDLQAAESWLTFKDFPDPTKHPWTTRTIIGIEILP